MLILSIVIGYLVLSLLTTRIVFVRKLGTDARSKTEWKYANLSDPNDFNKISFTTPTKQYNDAVIWAAWIGLLWLIAFPLFLIFTTPTPYERNSIKEAESKKLERRYKEMEKLVAEFQPK